MLIPLVLGLVLIVSFVTDIRKRRIFNIVTIPAIFIALIYYTIILGWDGFLLSGKGFLVGLGLLIIPYLMGGMGAGDVKLMAAIGALMGPEFTLYSFIFTAIIGGIIALIIIIKSKGFLNLIKSWWYILKSIFFKVVFLKNNLGEMVIYKNNSSASKIAFPYGVAIVLGTVCAIVLGG